MNHISRLAGALAAVLLVTACGGEGKAPSTETAAPSTPSAAAGPVKPGPGGKIITVNLTTDEKGSYFEPAEIVANKGDVVQFTLKVGVHNVHFLSDSNAKVNGYRSAPSEMLQLPGQTYDVLVDMPTGKYYFQCDPHALLGMVGHLTVQ
jgi:plastocyanin